MLVVDDEPQITRVLRTVLTSQGYQVRTAAEGRGGAVELRRVPAGARDHRPLHAAHGRRRVVPADPRDVGGADHRAVGERRGADQGRGARLAAPTTTSPSRSGSTSCSRASAPRCGAAAASREMASFEAGEFRVDLEGRRVHVRGQEVRLTPKEFELFVYMARHPNRVHHAPHAARSGLGRSVAGAAGVPARLHGTAAQEARTRSVEPAIPGDRAVGRLSVQSERLGGLGLGAAVVTAASISRCGRVGRRPRPRRRSGPRSPCRTLQ